MNKPVMWVSVLAWRCSFHLIHLEIIYIGDSALTYAMTSANGLFLVSASKQGFSCRTRTNDHTETHNNHEPHSLGQCSREGRCCSLVSMSDLSTASTSSKTVRVYAPLVYNPKNPPQLRPVRKLLHEKAAEKRENSRTNLNAAIRSVKLPRISRPLILAPELNVIPAPDNIFANCTSGSPETEKTSALTFSSSLSFLISSLAANSSFVPYRHSGAYSFVWNSINVSNSRFFFRLWVIFASKAWTNPSCCHKREW